MRAFLETKENIQMHVDYPYLVVKNVSSSALHTYRHRYYCIIILFHHRCQFNQFNFFLQKKYFLKRINVLFSLVLQMRFLAEVPLRRPCPNC